MDYFDKLATQHTRTSNITYVDAKDNINLKINNYNKNPSYMAAGPRMPQNFRLKGEYHDEDKQHNIDMTMFNKKKELNDFDAYTKDNYTLCDEICAPLVNPIKNGPEYYMTQIINCLSLDLYQYIRSLYTNNIIFYSSYLLLCSLSVLYSVSNDRELKTFFQNKNIETVLTGINKIESQLDVKINNIIITKNPDLINSPYQNLSSVSNSIESINEFNNLNNFYVIDKEQFYKYNNPNNIMIYNTINFELIFRHNYNKINIIKTQFLGKNKRIIRSLEYEDAFLFYNEQDQLLEIPCDNNLVFGFLLNNKNVKYNVLEEYIKKLKLIHFAKITIPYIKQQVVISIKSIISKIGLKNLLNNFRINNNNTKIDIFNQYIKIIFNPNSDKMNSLQNHYTNDVTNLNINNPFIFYIRSVYNNAILAYGNYN
ncbi:hypothetical protein Hokovirus_2_103 [Hokovirus HKV1]|uniref:Serpin domain-containing protein n=1 Tax=Hokovirus HKV1 TaxID=1977638 RepID=A0A1V0SFS0_9VIRU|nr:hypothetical protein Hokovirus_2_103 [Hokovirus HKV1]